MKKVAKGFSFQITGGTAYAGFYVSFQKLSWRVCLGWVAFTLFFFDPEPSMTEALKQYTGKHNE